MKELLRKTERLIRSHVPLPFRSKRISRTGGYMDIDKPITLPPGKWIKTDHYDVRGHYMKFVPDSEEVNKDEK